MLTLSPNFVAFISNTEQQRNLHYCSEHTLTIISSPFIESEVARQLAYLGKIRDAAARIHFPVRAKEPH